jgi:hypothetical protein
VARLEAIWILLAYACAHNIKLYQIDVKSAFLNGIINELVFVEQPPGFEDDKCNIPAQGLTGLIGYSYQQVATSFLEAHLERTPKLSVLGLERWVTDREVLPGCA